MGGEKAAWYQLHAHAPTTPRKVGAPNMTIFLVYMYLQYTSVNDYFRLKCQNLYVSKYESLVKILASKNFVVYVIMHVHDQTAHIHVFLK